MNITFETSCLRTLVGYDKTPLEELIALERIMSLAKSGKLQIWISWKSIWEIEERLAKESDPERIVAWKTTIEKARSFEELPGLFMLGFSHLGSDTMLASDKDVEFLEFLQDIAHPDTNPGDIARGHLFDISILVDHKRLGNNLFVTRDKHFLKKHISEELRDKWGVIACNPIQAFELLKTNDNYI